MSCGAVNAQKNEQFVKSLVYQNAFENQAGVYGNITSIGSDSMASLLTLWSQGFESYYPHVRFQIQAAGSATAFQAISQGIANIGPMSRALNQAEIERFERIYGYPPLMLKVAIDAIGIYVQRQNPLDKITIKQLDAIFSATRWCGAMQPITHWDQLGVDKFNKGRSIQVFSRASISGTYDLFKESVLCGGDFISDNNEMPSSNSVVQSVASSIGGIGYAAHGRNNERVKMLALSENSQDYYLPTSETIRTSKYPLTRNLYLLVNKSPNQPLPLLQHAFLNFILSDEGQNIVRNEGYFSITEQLANRQLRLLNQANASLK